MSVFINLSNHPSARWSKEQLGAAQDFGMVGDMPFPNIQVSATAGDLDVLAAEVVAEIKNLAQGGQVFVLAQGEMGLTFRVVTALKAEGIVALTAVSERGTVENKDGTKTVSFNFKGFREY